MWRVNLAQAVFVFRRGDRWWLRGRRRRAGVRPRVSQWKAHNRGRKKEGKREGEARPTSQEEEGSSQNMVVSYLVLMVRLDSFWSTSHVALPCDWASPSCSAMSPCGHKERGGVQLFASSHVCLKTKVRSVWLRPGSERGLEIPFGNCVFMQINPSGDFFFFFGLTFNWPECFLSECKFTQLIKMPDS